MTLWLCSLVVWPYMREGLGDDAEVKRMLKDLGAINLSRLHALLAEDVTQIMSIAAFREWRKKSAQAMQCDLKSKSLEYWVMVVIHA